MASLFGNGRTNLRGNAQAAALRKKMVFILIRAEENGSY